jgi:hypothetical protein
LITLLKRNLEWEIWILRAKKVYGPKFSRFRKWIHARIKVENLFIYSAFVFDYIFLEQIVKKLKFKIRARKLKFRSLV